MSSQYERYEIAYVEEYGRGVVRQRNAHYAIIEFSDDGHLWSVVVDDDDYVIIDDINIAHKELM